MPYQRLWWSRSNHQLVNIANGTLPYGISWSSGETTNNINNKSAGVYVVTVTDANSCISTCQITFEEPTDCCGLTVQSNTNTRCFNNGTANVQMDDRVQFTLTVSGSGSFYNVSVSGGTTISPSTGSIGSTQMYLLGEGTSGSGVTYTVTITDSTDPTCLTSIQVASPANTCSEITPCPTKDCGGVKVIINDN